MNGLCAPTNMALRGDSWSPIQGKQSVPTVREESVQQPSVASVRLRLSFQASVRLRLSIQASFASYSRVLFAKESEVINFGTKTWRCSLGN